MFDDMLNPLFGEKVSLVNSLFRKLRFNFYSLSMQMLMSNEGSSHSILNFSKITFKVLKFMLVFVTSFLEINNLH